MTDGEMLNEALDLIVEIAQDDDWICEKVIDYDGSYCAENCQNLNRLCVQHFLEIRKRKEVNNENKERAI